MESSRLKILFVVHNQTQKGGAYYRGVTLGAPLARRGHDVTLMSIHPTRRIFSADNHLDGLQVIETPDLLSGAARSGWDPYDTLWRVQWLARRKFDVVHTIDTRPAVSLPVMATRRFTGSRWVADWTDWWGRGGAINERGGGIAERLLAPLEQFFEEWPRPYADGTIVISRALMERAIGLGVDHQKILYLPPGTDPNLLRSTSIEDARRSLGIDQSSFVIGYLGNIYQRDADMLFSSLAELGPQPFKLIMVGEPRCQLPAAFSKHIMITGRLPLETMLAYLSASNVLALPLTDTIANRGRWPSKINEYLAVGRPVVASAVGDVADLFRRHNIGKLVPPDPVSFGYALADFQRHSEEAAVVGENARNLASTEYSQEAVADRLETFYEHVLSMRDRGV